MDYISFISVGHNLKLTTEWQRDESCDTTESFALTFSVSQAYGFKVSLEMKWTLELNDLSFFVEPRPAARTRLTHVVPGRRTGSRGRAAKKKKQWNNIQLVRSEWHKRSGEQLFGVRRLIRVQWWHQEIIGQSTNWLIHCAFISAASDQMIRSGHIPWSNSPFCWRAQLLLTGGENCLSHSRHVCHNGRR